MSIVIYGCQDEPSTLELVMIILNYVACVPVLLSVGIFRYAPFALLGSLTLISLVVSTTFTRSPAIPLLSKAGKRTNDRTSLRKAPRAR